ncbi:hypothetical protein [Hydrogenimonas sp.]
MNYLIRESLIFLVLFLLLSLGVHMDAWTGAPLSHIEALPRSPLGALHPLYITLGVYLLLLWPLRWVARGLKKLFGRRKQ